MKALVVYESMFGNTRTVAEAVADGLRAHLDSELVEVGAAPATLPPDVDLLVVGAPTHAFGLSSAATRRSAADRGPDLISRETGVREWLEDLPLAPGVRAATFDTRVGSGRLTGSAAKRAARRLRRLGLDLSPGRRSFWVTGTTGPLEAGQEQRARAWGSELGAAVTSRPAIGPDAVR
jgi:Flavodoxin